MPWKSLQRLIGLWIGLLLLAGCGRGAVGQDDPTSATYQPTPPQPQDVGPRLVGPITYTVDARSRDVWMYFYFSPGSVMGLQGPKTDSRGLTFPPLRVKNNRGGP